MLGLFMCFPNQELPVELLVVCLIVIAVFDYILILHKDKYLKYFKKFDKKPHKWKIKWAWISFLTIFFLYSFFLFSGLVLNPYFKDM